MALPRRYTMAIHNDYVTAAIETDRGTTTIVPPEKKGRHLASKTTYSTIPVCMTQQCSIVHYKKLLITSNLTTCMKYLRPSGQ